MTEQVAFGPIKRLQVEAVVLRAVPCADHAAYTLDCPDCLTGEQAAALGVAHERHELGVIADSSRRFRYGPGRIRAWWRTRQANRRRADAA